MNTSAAAYASMLPHIPSIKLRILAFIVSKGEFGATREECGKGCGLEHQSINGRLRELEVDLKIADSGRVRAQKSGRFAVVWVAPEFAPEPEPVDPEYDFDPLFYDQECDE